MKLHINRKKRKGIRRFISIALVLCMTFSIGSPYVTAEASNTTVESQMPEEKSAAVETGQNSESVVRPAEDNSSDTSQDKAEATGGDTKKDGAPADDDQNEKENINIEGTPSDTTPAPDGTPVPETTQDPDSTGNPENTLGPDSTENPEATPAPETTENPEATPAPETTENPEATPVPETTENPETTQAPEKTESPAQTQAPEAVQSPEPAATPEASQSPAPGQTPVVTVPEEDFSDLMSLDELTGLSMETAGATRFRAARVLGSERNYTANDGTWSFDTYYVNEADRYNVTKTDDFSLKYQMEFHASRDFEAGEVKIRIDGALLTERYGYVRTPNDIGVPVANWDEDNNLSPNPSRSTSFNYYYTNEDETIRQNYPDVNKGVHYLVFYNYKDITSGTNAAWQVLYSNLQLMQIEDETSWSKMPQISIDRSGYADTSANTLTGRINSSVSMNSVVKTPYYEAGRKYTPGLYTLAQVQSYVDNVDWNFITWENGKQKLNPAYRYVVWDVKITGSATQPWTLFVQDAPKVDGKDVGAKVVGYKDHSDPTTVYDMPVYSYNMNYGNCAAESWDKKSWGHRFWVVTAYPADKVEANTTVQNDFTVILHPQDGKDQDVVLAATPATWSYKDYDWKYDGNVIGVTKKNTWSNIDDTTEYTGWLEAYRRAREKGEDYGEIPFTVTGRMNGYETTHHVEGSQLGEYKQGTSYTLITTDDLIYVHNGKEGDNTDNEKLLGAKDYYFSSVTVNQRDYGYDIYEDKMTDSERQALVDAGKLESGFGEVKIYAMFAKSDDGTPQTGTENWELAGSVPMDTKGNATYSFTKEQIAREPYRVKAEHDSVDYRTTCEIKLSVRIKAGSTTMDEIVNDRQQGAEYNVSPKIRFENFSGVMGIQKAEGQENTVCNKLDPSSGNINYEGREELAEKTKALYNDNLLVRDSAFRDVSWLNMTSQANKKYTSKNDAKNNRVLVDYYLTAYDGYEIYDRSCLDYLTKSEQELMSPGRKHVVFYDLLPYGMQFDASTPVTAGRIKELDVKGDYMTRTRSWDSTQVSVTVDPDRDIIPDYKGTGRTMVAFHISYSGADSTTYTAKKWIEGWGVSFRAYYDWKNMESINKVNANANLCAFMPDFSVKDGINETNPMLYGLQNSVYADNGEIADTEKAKLYKDLLVGDGKPENKGNIDGNSQYDTYTDKDGKVIWNRNVLYADEKLDDNVATSSESKITKAVRADEDRFGTFKESATVSYDKDSQEASNGCYTYEITVGADESDIRGIVAFDRLENAAKDRADLGEGKKDPFAPFSQKTWHGTFLSVDLSALEKQGITGTEVYYNASRDAVIEEPGKTPEEILTENGWYTQSDFETEMKKTHGEEYTSWTEYVQAVAVKFDPEYKLEKGHSVSFRIQMKAPAKEEDTKDAYAYNNVFFSSYVAEQPDTRATVSSNSVRVGVSRPERLEIVKRTAGVVPTDLQNEKFAFRLSEKYTEGGEPQYLAFQAYDLYKVDKNAGWVKQEGELHATDENGYLYLKADEKAVFKVADTDRILVEEKPSVFWESNPAPGETVKEEIYREETASGQNRRVRDENGDIHVRTWTNTYRPVLYVQKDLAAVPGNVTLSEADRTFTFKLEVEKNGEYKPLANAEFWYVDSVLLDGGVPTRVNKDGEVWTEENGRLDTKRTASDGTFTIKEGQIIALFPGVAGTKYRLTEENLDENGYGLNQNQNWYCSKSEITGTIPAEGSSETITNYYRWKDLYLTKKLTHQDPAECTQNFIFQIIELELDENGRLMLDAEGNPIEVKKLDASGNPVLDGNGNQITATAGKTWRLQSTEGTDGTGTVASGTLDNEGKFTYALAGKTAIISGLEAGKYYLVKEMAIDMDQTTGVVLYQPVKDSEEFKLPPYSVKKEVTITNDYLKRPLSVTKTVSGEKNDTNPNPEFEFTIKVNNELLPAGISYTVTEQGNVVDGGTGVTDGTGKFKLRGGQTVTFKDAGMLGQNFEVTETSDAEYEQLYPANNKPATGTLSGEGGQASFVNGSANALRISKEYVAAENDIVAERVLHHWKDKLESWEYDDVIISDYSDECSSEFVLEVTDEQGTYIWPQSRRDAYVIAVNQLTGKSSIFIWEKGKSIKLPPWMTLTIEFGEGNSQISKDVTYTLSEVESSQKRIVECNGKYLQISQKYPTDKGSITGTVASTPNATIVNEISTLTFNGSKVGKQMTSTSSEVPTGEKLVWRLEKYENGSWIPAEGISYAVFDDAGTPISNEVRTTEADGKIVLTKTEGHYPEVWFTENTVYINLYNTIDEVILNMLGHVNGTPLLRLVEVPEESGKEWGMLVGYGTKGKTSYGWISELLNPQNEVRTFFNSNRKASIEIEKYMETKSYQEFTMILEQVVAVRGDAKEISPNNYGERILKSEPRGGVSYTIHNVDGSEVTGTKNGTTGPGGEIRLKAGQYVILDVPDGTVWTVSEDVYATKNYELKDLAPDIDQPGGKLTKLDDNLMLINLPATMRYTLIYDGNGKGNVVSNVPAPMTVDVNSTAETADFTVSSGVPVRDGYIFKGWAKVQDAELPEYGAGSPIHLTPDNLTMTLYAVWERGWPYKLTYMDRGTIYNVQERLSSKNSESFMIIDCTNTRNGYIFTGWSTDASTNHVDYESGNTITLTRDNSDVTLYAVWEEKIDNTKIAASKSPSKEYPKVGEEFSYTISITNKNSKSVTVTITDRLDERLEFVSAGDGGTYDPTTRTVTWTDISVPGSGGKNVNLSVKAKSAGEIYNEAKAQWDGGSTSGNTKIEAWE